MDETPITPVSPPETPVAASPNILPTVDGAPYRGVVTALQAFLGYVVVLLADPNVQGIVGKHWPQFAVSIPLVSGFCAYILGLLRPGVNNY